MIKKIKSLVHGLIDKNTGKRKINDPFESRVSSHFLFNSLNAAAALCYKNPEAAAGLIVEISTYLQKSLEEKAFLIALEEELEHVLSYIYIQKARFPDRLKIVLDIEDNLPCRIPAFTLQPVVDNAIRHGVLKRKQGGLVGISVKKLPQSVRISIKDDGDGMTAGEVAALLKRRNKHHSLYKVEHIMKAAGFKGMTIASVQNEGTTVAFEIPLHSQA